ncbi:MAG: protein kinase [Acidobacteria bacterium]|nr:protein kinase [Acidobacteriota bacterium]
MANEVIGKVIAEKYRVDALIRQGADGDLYQATHLLMEKPLSIRILPSHLAHSQAAADRFFEESKIAARIVDANAFGAVDFGTDANGIVYSVHDVASARTLKSIILRDGAFPADSAVETSRQIARALAAAHAAGVVHGNLTAENVLLADGPEKDVIVKVADFSTPNALSRIGPGTDDPADLAYLSPEQCSGSDQPDERSDIYSLGILVYEMLAGVVPFTGEKASDIMAKHIEEPPAPLVAFRSDIPKGIEPVMLKAMSKDPATRQQTAQEFIDEISAAMKQDHAGHAAAATAGGTDLWKTALAVIVGIGALAAVMIYATQSKQTDPQTVLMPDTNGQPVQPINPATGAEEQQLAAMPNAFPETLTEQGGLPIDTIPGGDGYNPWATGAPPPGAPQYQPPGGYVTIDPNSGSPFMPNDPGTVVLVPVPANTASEEPKPSPSPGRSPASNTNTAPAERPAPATPAPSPRQTPRQQTPQPTPAKTPVVEDPEGS